MGRKRRLPALAREKAVAEEVASARESEQKVAALKAKPNDALFVIDAAGSSRKRRKMQKAAKTEKFLSKAEKKLIVHKYLGKALPRPKLRKPISDPWEVEGELQGSSTGTTLALPSTTEGAAGSTTEAGTTITTHEGGAASSTDASAVEGDNDFLVLPKKMGQRKRPKPSASDLAKLPVCHPGQSYNPTEEDHDDVLATAVTVELRRQEAVDAEKMPVSQGMSKETLDVLIGDEEEESSDEEDPGGEVSLGKPTPATGKLTRAQRNKQKRVKEAAYELSVRRKKKNMLKSIDQVVALQQEVADQERLREERRQTKRHLKAEAARVEAEGAGLLGPSAGVTAMISGRHSNKDVIASRSVPVNLGEELHGSLRKLRAQGSVLLDKVELLKANKAHPDRRHGKDRAKKAHKGFRKKHTYKDRYKDD